MSESYETTMDRKPLGFYVLSQSRAALALLCLTIGLSSACGPNKEASSYGFEGVSASDKGESGEGGLGEGGSGEEGVMDNGGVGEEDEEEMEDEEGLGGETKFDLAPIPDAGVEKLNCTTMDILFVVDNSGSMEGFQENLANSAPGLVSTIQETLGGGYQC